MFNRNNNINYQQQYQQGNRQPNHFPNSTRLEIRWNKKVYLIEPNLNEGVLAIKQILQIETGLTPEAQVLIFKGQKLRDNDDLSTKNIADGSVIMLVGSAKQQENIQNQQQQQQQQQNNNNGNQNHSSNSLPSYGTLPSFFGKFSSDRLIEPFSPQDIQELFAIFNEDKNKGLKHVSDIFVNILQKQDTISEQETMEQLQHLEEILEELSSPKSVNNIYGVTILLNISLHNKYFKARKMGLSLLGMLAQNNQSIQKPAIQQGALISIMNFVVQNSQIQGNQKLVEQGISTLGKLLRGEYLDGKKVFIQVQGVQFLNNLLTSQESSSITQKVLYTLRDLVKSDQNCQNQAKQTLINLRFIENKLYILQNINLDHKEARMAYVNICVELLMFNRKIIQNVQKVASFIQQVKQAIQPLQDSQDEIQHILELQKYLY